MLESTNAVAQFWATSTRVLMMLMLLMLMLLMLMMMNCCWQLHSRIDEQELITQLQFQFIFLQLDYKASIVVIDLLDCWHYWQWMKSKKWLILHKAKSIDIMKIFFKYFLLSLCVDIVCRYCLFVSQVNVVWEFTILIT